MYASLFGVESRSEDLVVCRMCVKLGRSSPDAPCVASEYPRANPQYLIAK